MVFYQPSRVRLALFDPSSNLNVGFSMMIRSRILSGVVVGTSLVGFACGGTSGNGGSAGAAAGGMAAGKSGAGGSPLGNSGGRTGEAGMSENGGIGGNGSGGALAAGANGDAGLSSNAGSASGGRSGAAGGGSSGSSGSVSGGSGGAGAAGGAGVGNGGAGVGNGGAGAGNGGAGVGNGGAGAGNGGASAGGNSGGLQFLACLVPTAIDRIRVQRIDAAAGHCTTLVLQDTPTCHLGLISGTWCLSEASVSTDLAACRALQLPAVSVAATAVSGTFTVTTGGKSVSTDLQLTFPASASLPASVNMQVESCKPNCNNANDCRN